MTASASRERLLLVEDNFVIALDLAERMERLGLVVDGPHASAEGARAACEKQLPDAAVLDVCLRGGSSIPLAEWLTSLGVAVVFVTGYGELPELSRALATLPQLKKPLADGVLERALLEQLAANRR